VLREPSTVVLLPDVTTAPGVEMTAVTTGAAVKYAVSVSLAFTGVNV
jgi:hypothetical protein